LKSIEYLILNKYYLPLALTSINRGKKPSIFRTILSFTNPERGQVHVGH